MPSFGRSSKSNNRSQHNFAVDAAGPSAGPVSSASGLGHHSHQHQLHQLQGSVGFGVPSSGAAVAATQSQAQQAQGPGSHGHSHGQGHDGLTAAAQLQGPSSTTSSSLSQGTSNLAIANASAPNNDAFVQTQQGLGSGPGAGDLNAATQQHIHQLHQLHPLNTGGTVSDAKVRKAASQFVDAVARSQSQKYPQVATPIQPNPAYGASYEDLSRTTTTTTLHAAPQLQQSFSSAYHHLPNPPPPPQPQPQPQQQQQQQQGAPVEPRRSTRRLIRDFIAGTPKLDQHRSDHSHSHHNSQSQLQSQSQAQSQAHNYYDSGAGPGRRNSKRISNPNPPPSALRTGPSQVSLDQTSPLQNNPLEFQQPPPQPPPTLRRVPTNTDQSPYSDVEEGPFHQHGQAHLQFQAQSPLLDQQQQQQLGQGAAYDPATRQYQFIAHSPNHSPQGPDASQSAYAAHLGTDHLQNNPETISQVSHESPIGEGDFQNPPSNIASAAASPAVRYSQQASDFPSRTSSLQPHQQLAPSTQQQQQQTPDEVAEQHNMAPPTGGTPQVRRPENDKPLRGEMQQTGPPPGYRHSHQPSLPSGGQGAPGQNNFRSSTIQDRPPPQFDGQADSQGRSSPQPSEDPEKSFKDLLQKYKNVKRLYFDGKTQIEQLNGQVEQLQNAVANQRISQSRTALDDQEYTTRFNRLNGAINNLSFNIRKDWTSLPAWLDKYVSADALKTGKQEMTAVGRAVITRWIVDEIFFSCFHPGLDPELSKQLKRVEQNIRHFSYTLTSQEEFDALTSKVLSWRMTTLEGLQDVLNSPDSADHRQEFIRNATAGLTSWIFEHLADPAPPGVEGSASMIVELAVGIAANLPLESRDVAITYPLPESPIQAETMDVEKAGLPAIETRSPDSDGDGEDGGKESGGEKSSSSKERSKSSRAGTSAISTLSNFFLGNAPPALVPGHPSRKGGGGGDSGGELALASQQQQPSSGAPGAGRKPSVAVSVTDSVTHLALPPKDSSKVRFAGFLAVEVRGRQVLVKAPVWTLG